MKKKRESNEEYMKSIREIIERAFDPINKRIDRTIEILNAHPINEKDN
jgi:hypothetical protein